MLIAVSRRCEPSKSKRLALPSGIAAVRLVRKLLSPPRQPVFQESDPDLSGLSFTFADRSEHLHSTLFRLTTIIQTPGYCATEKWGMICERHAHALARQLSRCDVLAGQRLESKTR